MISLAIIAAVLTSTAQYNYPSQPSGPAPSQAQQEGGFDAAPYAQLYRKCFQTAEDEAAAADVRQQQFDACRSKRDTFVSHATARLDGREAAYVRQELDRALRDVEKSYAKRMGLIMPEPDK